MKIFFQGLLNFKPREKCVVVAGIVALVVVMIYVLLQTNMNFSTQKLAKNKKLLINMQTLDRDILQLKNQSRTDKNSLMMVIQSTLQVSPLKNSIENTTQKSDGTVGVQFKVVNFDELMRWLVLLRDQKGIVIESFEATAIEIQFGYVSAELVLRSL